MNRRMAGLVTGVLMVLLTGSAFAASSVLYFKSEQGDYIGGGVERFFASGDFAFSASSNFGNGVSLSVTNFLTPDPQNYSWWYLDFVAANAAQLVPGAYETAARFPFQEPTQPGLSISGDGRGCNTLTGRFDVLEAEYAPGGEVAKFAANFEQHCEGMAPALYGEIRFNSDIPISVLVPAKITLENPLNPSNCLEASKPAGAMVRVNGLESKDGQGGTNLAYAWQTSSGAAGSGPSFKFPVSLDQTVEVKLTIEDLATGETSTAARQICVSDTTPPQITILSPVAGERMVGNQVAVEVSIQDAVDQYIRDFELFLGTSGSFPLDPAKASTKVNLLQGQAGADAMAVELKVKAQDASGNSGEASVNVLKVHDLGKNSR